MNTLNREDVSSLASVSRESLEETRGACAWLHDIALESEAMGYAPPGLSDWIERLGMHCTAELQRRGLFPIGGLQ
jgi:hypothetical protein